MNATPRRPAATDLTLEDRMRLLSGGSVWRTQELDGVPAVTMTDGPHGLRVQRGSGEDHLGVAPSLPATCFPTAVTLAATWDEALAEEVGAAVAEEAREQGVNVVLGPGLNIKRHPLGGRSCEYLSEDPLVSGRMAAALVRGLQSRGVGASVKHFAVNNQESHRFVVDAVVDERTLREIYLSGFEHVVRTARPWTVMCAYNSLGGELCSENRPLLTGILREEWGFDGLVVSDWGAVSDRAKGVAAGLDLEMPGGHTLSDAEVLAAVADGSLAEDDVTTSAQRVLDLVGRALDTGTVAGGEGATESGTVTVHDAHDALARRVAAEGTVLLANDGTLPLRPDARVALIGTFATEPRYQGAGSSLVNARRVTTALEALQARGVDVRHAPGGTPDAERRSPALLAEAVAAAGEADVAVVMVGLPERFESEGFDRADLALPPAHDELVRAVAATGTPTVVALSNGAPVLLPWRDEVAAIVESSLGGQASGGALADVLLGDVEPGGRLAETFPAAASDVAADPYFPGEPRQVEYREGLFVGYRHHVSGGPQPAFPFGHGLSYTRIELSDLTLRGSSVAPDPEVRALASLEGQGSEGGEVRAGEPVTVEITATNIGDRPGSEVVQVYRRDLTGLVLRPERELVGFAKVRLEPGDSTRVRIELDERAFAFWDVDAAGWRTPEGDHELLVGRSSVDIAGEAVVRVTGGVTEVGPGTERPGTPAVAASDEAFAARLGRPIPAAAPVRPFTRSSTFDEIAQTRPGRLFRDVVRKVAVGPQIAAAGPGQADMIERSFAELPLRAAARIGGGMLPWRVVDGVVRLANLTRRRG